MTKKETAAEAKREAAEERRVEKREADAAEAAERIATIEKAELDATTVDYRAKSIFVSKAFWANAIVFTAEILDLTEVVNVIPAGWNMYLVPATAAGNVVLRWLSVRPVAIIGPMSTKVVKVDKI